MKRILLIALLAATNNNLCVITERQSDGTYQRLNSGARVSGSESFYAGISRGSSSSSSSGYYRFGIVSPTEICTDSRDISSSSSRSSSRQPPISAQDREITALKLGSDPHRYGKIEIDAATLTDQDRKEAHEFMKGAQKEMYYSRYFDDHAKVRVKIAKAVMCGETIEKFMYIAANLQDYPLLEILLRHKMDPNTPLSDALCSNPALALAQSSEVAHLLVQHGASMKITTTFGTLLHQACDSTCKPNLLAYYLEHASIDVNNTQSHQNGTPLHSWAKLAIDGKNTLIEAQEKLTLLINAGAALNRRNAANKTPLDILKEKRRLFLGASGKTLSPQRLAQYDAFIAQISAAIQAQNPIQPTAQTDDLSCAICLDEANQYSFCTLTCKHVYHTGCINEWLAQKDSCPICRVAVIKD